MKSYDYLLVGGGAAADSAARAIRARDPRGTIGMLCAESIPPYNRPPLSKGLWQGMPLEQIWRDTAALEVELHLSRTAVTLDRSQRLVIDDQSETYRYAKLLIATGGSPVRLPQDDGSVLYYRDLADYKHLRGLCQSARRFAVIGGGFIGSELAALLASQDKEVTLLFMEDGICARFLPSDLSMALNSMYEQRGVKLLPSRQVAGIARRAGLTVIETVQGDRIEVDAVVAGLGIRPNAQLASQAGLAVNNGILVNAAMQTSDPDIFAAGDVVAFPDPRSGTPIRVEHEEHANLSGQVAGANMSGGQEVLQAYTALYSSLFDIQYEAIGRLDSSAQIVADWIEPYRSGVLYYLSAARIDGILLWNIPGALSEARKLLAQNVRFTEDTLIGLIRPQKTIPRRVIRLSRGTQGGGSA